MKTFLSSVFILLHIAIQAQSYIVGEPTINILYSTSYYSNGICGSNPTVTVSFPNIYVTGVDLEIHITSITANVSVNSQMLEVGSILSNNVSNSFDFYYLSNGSVSFDLIAAGTPEIPFEEYVCSHFEAILGLSECNDFMQIQPTDNSIVCSVQDSDAGITYKHIDDTEVVGTYDLLGNKITEYYSGVCIVLYNSGKTKLIFQ